MDPVTQLRVIALGSLTVMVGLTLGLAGLVTWLLSPRERPATSAPIRRALASVANVYHASTMEIRRWRSRSQTMRELTALDNHILKDIGVERGEIPHVAAALSNPAPAAETPQGRPLEGVHAEAPARRLLDVGHSVAAS